MKHIFNKSMFLAGVSLMFLLIGCQNDPIDTSPDGGDPVEVKDKEEDNQPKPVDENFRIIEHSDPTITTHSITSGNPGDQFILGITSNGGGIINQMIVPGLAGDTDIMGVATDMYGRAGQVAIRDQAHRGKYNPTQSGHDEELGTKCTITVEPGKLIVEPRGMALWHGDGQYDFTRWENIGEDAYSDFEPNRFGYTDNGNSDVDPLDEEDLEGKMATEVHSEFDYYGTYEDWFGKEGITAATIHHYYQISYIRPPGHCINQFSENSTIWNANKISNDISNRNPAGVHRGTDKDLSGMIGVWSIRNDSEIWLPTHVYYRTPAGVWKVRNANTVDDDLANIDDTDNEVFINANGINENTSRGICLYRPNTDINFNSIIGVNEKTGTTVYKDNRFETRFTHLLKRAPTLAKFGFVSNSGGMINRTRLGNDVYEAYRNEVFMLYGSPKQIKESIEIIDRLIK